MITTLMIGTAGLSAPSFADDSNGTVFYTLFDETNPFNVKSVDFNYDSGTNTLSLMNIVNIGHTDDADGIVVNPQDMDLLIIGTAFNSTPDDGTDDNLATVVIADGTVATYSSPVPTFHLELTDSTTIYASAIPGDLSRHTINGDGTLTTGTQITLSGDDTAITQLITITGGPDAGKFYYTTSNFLGTGNYGELTFGAGDTATTDRIHGPGGLVSDSPLPAAHGGEYDPFSDSVMIVGANHISQLDPTDGTVLCDLEGGVDFTEPAGFDHFDQGIVDGNGHLVIADNGGNLFLVDYSGSGDLCDVDTQITSAFLDETLDDIAPFIMPPDEPFCDCEKPTEFTVAYDGPDVQKINLFKKGKDVGDAGAVQLMPVVNGDGEIVVNSNDLPSPKTSLPPNLFYEITTVDGNTEVIRIHVSCSELLFIGQEFTEGDITLTVVDGINKDGDRSIPDSPDVCPICKEEEHDDGDQKSPIVMSDHDGDNSIGSPDSAGSAQSASSAGSESSGLETCPEETECTVDTASTARTGGSASSSGSASSGGSASSSGSASSGGSASSSGSASSGGSASSSGSASSGGSASTACTVDSASSGGSASSSGSASSGGSASSSGSASSGGSASTVDSSSSN